MSTCVPGLNSYIWCMLRGENEVVSWHHGAEEGLGRKVKASPPDEGISRSLWAWMSATNSLLRFQHLLQEIS